MKLLNDDQTKAIIEGIIEGYKSVGKELNELEQAIVKISVGTTVDTIETVIDLKEWFYLGHSLNINVKGWSSREISSNR